MRISRTVTAAILASTFMFTLVACEDEGPLEQTGEEIDDAAEGAGDAFEDATN
ncbi:MAG: hypothetical protein WEB57_11955 [Pseudohongiellaceae bacterium]